MNDLQAMAFLAGFIFGSCLGCVAALWWTGRCNEKAYKRAMDRLGGDR